MQDEVKVTQAARDAAADHTTGFGHIDGYTFSTPHMVRTGHCDNHPLVQAFAKFEQSIRHQAVRETLARMEPGELERLRAENETARDILSNLSSYLGAGMGDDNTTPEQFDARIRWGIDHIGRVYRDRAAQVVEECSKRPCTTWGKVKRAILDDTCLPTALPPAPEAGQ